LKHITPADRFFEVLKETVLDLQKEKKQRTKTEKRKCRKQLSVLQRKRKKIFEMREDETYSKDDFLERKREIEEEISEIKNSLEEGRNVDFDVKTPLDYSINFIRNLDQNWPELDPRLQRRFQNLIFPEGISYQKKFGFGTARMGYIYALNEQFDGQKSSIVPFLVTNWNQFIMELKEWQDL